MLTVDCRGEGGITSRFSGRLVQVSGGELVKAERGKRLSSSEEQRVGGERGEIGGRGERAVVTKILH